MEMGYGLSNLSSYDKGSKTKQVLQKKGVSPMSTEENKALMRRVFEEVYNQRNPVVLDELCVPTWCFTMPH